MNLNILTRLSNAQKDSLKKGNIQNVQDLILSSPREIAEKCRITQMDARRIIDAVCSETTPPRMRRLEDVKHEGDEKCTTGDPHLDNALGGGIRTGMVWEVAGESAAGKTQLALQLSLFAQLPTDKGGLHGSTCYLTTSSTLPTSRLLQISQEHPILSGSSCGLEAVHTLSTPTIPTLIHVLSRILPPFIDERSQGQDSKPVKLLVVDALAELFHTSNKTTTMTLVERSKNISEVSILLHALASIHQIAVLVLNEVVDVFDRDRTFNVSDGDLVYSDQSRWFSRANSIPGEDRKEASLGLVWANQVNARILLTRTGRRRYLEDMEKNVSKRYKLDMELRNAPADIVGSDDQLTLIRRLSVVFSSVSRPISMDYIVTVAGISILSGGETYPYSSREALQHAVAPEKPIPCIQPSQSDPRSQISPLDVGIAEDGRQGDEDPPEDSGDVDPDNGSDEWDKYWDADDIPPDIYENVDLDGLKTQGPS